MLAEAAMAVGHPLGSLQLDRAFLEYFRVQIGEEVRDWRGKGQGKVVQKKGRRGEGRKARRGGGGGTKGAIREGLCD